MLSSVGLFCFGGFLLLLFFGAERVSTHATGLILSALPVAMYSHALREYVFDAHRPRRTDRSAHALPKRIVDVFTYVPFRGFHEILDRVYLLLWIAILFIVVLLLR